jgi:16S rRNA (uracil1498-N3)-methyltransferase
MQVFYAPEIDGYNYVLDEKESRHCIRVLRMRKGDPVKLIDGKGNLYEGTISNPDQDECEIKVTGVIHDFEKRNYRLHLAISPLKNPERFEWFTEKSVEIGVDEITPLICHNTEKQSIKTERIDNVIISAMKQSLKSIKTRLNEKTRFESLIDLPFDGVKMIAYCNGNFERKKISEACPPGRNALILIGPEGDFTNDEIREAIDSGFTPVHLGRSRLRTETAGIAACYSIYFINQ